MSLFSGLCLSASIFLFTLPKGQCAHIIGGKESVPHSRPYMAALGNATFFTCGGTLIKENWVLTAAHCFPMSNKFVVLGAHEQRKGGEQGRQHIKISKIFVYPDYNLYTFEHDIMLLKLQKIAKTDKYVRPLPLPSTSKDVQPGTHCLVTGWGRTHYKKRSSETLREVDVTVMDRETCNDEKHWNSKTVEDNMLCAGDRNAEKGFCLGDSGGPLICNGKQRGIVSFTREYTCGDPKYPGVYTGLTQEHLSWITRVMKSN
ncbi:granzyme A-like [Tiliqua scincoides]|uniref:granzyme A-like n=1 Tax=Tiliqua scincoides TaxID=71010 RepID=UPI0034626A35